MPTFQETLTDTTIDITRIRSIVGEFVGTFMFMFLLVVGSTVSELNLSQIPFWLTAVCGGFACAASMYAVAPASSAHLNPAVSLAMIASGNISAIVGVASILAQMLGSLAGAFFADFVVGHPSAYCTFIVPEEVLLRQAFMAEIMGSFIFVMVLFSVTVQAHGGNQDSYKGATKAIGPLIVGFMVVALHIAINPLTGCGVNPAHAFATSITQHDWTHHWLYWLAPIIGALIAVGAQFGVFGGFRPETKSQTTAEKMNSMSSSLTSKFSRSDQLRSNMSHAEETSNSNNETPIKQNTNSFASGQSVSSQRVDQRNGSRKMSMEKSDRHDSLV